MAKHILCSCVVCAFDMDPESAINELLQAPVTKILVKLEMT